MHGKRNGQTNLQTEKWTDDHQMDRQEPNGCYIEVVDNQIKSSLTDWSWY